jgi:hypothetical protein
MYTKDFIFYALGLKLAEIGNYSQKLVWRINRKEELKFK